ncbi:MAG: hypothetical protein JST54_17150 [Deltaproteobacteria bacterium]|nr:hypothetical protein [Deltaproteobacteria bacterium]
MNFTHAKTMRSQSGQVLPLAAVSLLALAVMVFLSINVSFSVRNRIRLQNYSDAKAYSTAVQEARAFNFYAYTNRAIAAGLVQAATLHAYMSEAAMMSSVDWGMFEAFGEISGCEYALAAAAFAEWDIGDGIEHTWHGIEADINAIIYMVDYFDGDMAGKIQKLDDPFNNALSALKTHIQILEMAQTMTHYELMMWLMMNKEIDQVHDDNMNDPNGGGVDTKNSMMVGLLNMQQYTGAVDTSDSDDKAKEMTAVANATRPPFTWDRNSFLGTSMTPFEVLLPMVGPSGPIESECEMDSGSFWGPIMVMQNPGNIMGFMSAGRSGITEGAFPMNLGIFQRDAPNDNTGTTVASYDSGGMAMFGWHDCPGMIPALPAFIIPSPIASGYIESNKNGSSAHYGDELMGMDLGFLSSPHSGGSHTFDTRTKSFIDFKSSSSSPYNQPMVYAYTSADMSQDDKGKTDHPWEVSQQGVSINVGAGGGGSATDTKLDNAEKAVKADTGDGKVVLGDKASESKRGKGRAISKAMVYYHRLGDWKEGPNFFNPYWRAKMESWDDNGELMKALMAGEMTDGLNIQQVLAMEGMQMLGSGALNVK